MFGRTSLAQNSVFPTRVSTDGSPVYKTGGVTIDWSTVAAASGDVTLGDGSIIKDGNKYLRYGQVICRIGSPGTGEVSGGYGPYDPLATDGRQTLTQGRCFIVDQTVLRYPSGAANTGAANDIIGGVLEGGSVWRNRLLCTGGAHSLAAGPTETELLAAFPGLFVVRDE